MCGIKKSYLWNFFFYFTPHLFLSRGFINLLSIVVSNDTVCCAPSFWCLEFLGRGLSLALLSALGQKSGVDVRHNSSTGNGDTTEQAVKLLVVADSQLDVAGNDTGTLVITSSVSGQLQDFSGQVLKDGSQVNGGTSSNAISIASVTQMTVNTTDGELQTSAVGASSLLSISLLLASLSSFTLSIEKNPSI